VYEITSNSLNTPCGNMTRTSVRFATEINPYRVGLTFFDTNYGNIFVDWTAEQSVIRLQGGVVLQLRALLGDPQP